MELLWIFLIYSFFGYLLEILFARAVGHPKRDRKCLILLPLCPVYGVGAMLIRFFTSGLRHPVWVMAVGFVAATAAELVVGAVYRWGLGVEFWNYRDMPHTIAGLVCLRFSLCWCVLSLVLVYGVDPWVSAWARAVPRWLDGPAFTLLAADLVVSAVALRRTGSTEVLRWYRSGQEG